jgi:hypothetical protein
LRICISFIVKGSHTLFHSSLLVSLFYNASLRFIISRVSVLLIFLDHYL